MDTRKRRGLVVLISAFSVLPAQLWACEPCAEEWGFEETVRHADVIIIAQKVAEGPHSNFDQEPGGPQWIDVRVRHVLKGHLGDRQIRVASWSAMCPYGIVVDEQSQVMLLVNPAPQEGRAPYDAVNHGCAVKVYRMVDDRVQFNGEVLSIDAFVERLNRAAMGRSEEHPAR